MNVCIHCYGRTILNWFFTQGRRRCQIFISGDTVDKPLTTSWAVFVDMRKHTIQKIPSAVPITSRDEVLGGDSSTEDDLISRRIILFLGMSLEISDCSSNYTSSLS